MVHAFAWIVTSHRQFNDNTSYRYDETDVDRHSKYSNL